LSHGTLHVTGACRPATELFQLIGDKWTMVVVVSLREGAMRFSELRRGIPGVSQRMLTLTLRTLERDGLISRRVTPTVPARVDYELTPLGQAFVEHIMPVGNWAYDNRTAIEKARAEFDARPSDIASEPPSLAASQA
jgi:DNA-binding HxlR family transcriptional regulator